MSAAVLEGETFSFTVRSAFGPVRVVCRRETDDPSPMFECERIRVTVLEQPLDVKHRPYTFGTEPAWFAERGLRAEAGKVAA